MIRKADMEPARFSILQPRYRRIAGRLGFVLFLLLLAGCSLNKLATRKMADTLAAGGSVFSSDDDPELVKAAVPFSLKLMESLLEELPEHEGLLLAASSGFVQYAFAFVEIEADEVEAFDFAKASQTRARAVRLYLRARDYGIRGLEVRHKGLEKRLRADPRSALSSAKAADVPFLYWTAASWASAIALSIDNPDLLAELYLVEALIDRALELDESYDSGAIHSFLIAYEMVRVGGEGDPVSRARHHYDRALELSEGRLASPMVTYAQSVAVQEQDHASFRRMLERALAIDPDLVPEARLLNLIMQRRARWLLSQADELFLGVPAD